MDKEEKKREIELPPLGVAKDETIFINPDAHSNRDIPNISLAYISTLYKVKVIDLNTLPHPSERFLQQKYSLVGISVQIRNKKSSEYIVNTYKKKYPKTKIVSLTGIVDVQCCYPFIKLENNLHVNIEFSDKLPVVPDYTLFDTFSIFQKKWRNGDWPYTIMTSLGCPYQCIFCASRNRKWRSRSPEHCFEELKFAKKNWNIKSFTVIDDAFNIDKERAIKFANLVSSLKMEWFISNGVRADRFDEDLAKALFYSGCRNISFGVESSDEEVLKIIKKGETIEQIKKAIKIAKKYFDSVGAFFIIGLPGSNYKKDLNSLKFAIKEGLYAHFSYYTPLHIEFQTDPTFYGENAKPRSNSYSPELQKKIFKIAKNLTWGGSERNFIKFLLGRLNILFFFGISSFLKYLFTDLKRLRNKVWRKLR